MSFSKDVKEELSRQISPARHCKIAEIAAIISMCGQIKMTDKQTFLLKVSTENLTVAKKYFILIKKTFHAEVEICVRSNRSIKKSKCYYLYLKKPKEVATILKSIKILDEEQQFLDNKSMVNGLVIQNTCCKRAFLRGIFLATGSVSDPTKAYHFEIVTSSNKKALGLCEIMQTFEIDAKIVLRKKSYVVYVKEGAQIVDLLNVMEAHVALMNFENVRILKEMRNSINRQVNCETANISKTVTAASKQIEDILYIKHTIGFGELSEALEQVAQLRVEHSGISLKELGEQLNPPIGKSGVNHRLRKLSNMAERLREQKEEVE